MAGYDVVREPAKVRLAIGCVAQKSGLDPAATGRENLILQGRVYGMRGVELKSRAAELLGRFGLSEAADRTVRTYSGGMQRKLDVAVGDRVMYAKYAGSEVKIDDVDYLILSEKDILAVVQVKA